METTFAITRQSREIYGSFIHKYSLGQLNKIPQGFNNNLIWNIGHIMVSQQMLAYLGSGNEPMVSREIIDRYKRGTKPESDATAREVEEIKQLLFTTITKTEEDYRNGLFRAYTERSTELGFTLATIDDALTFNNYHEGVHLGIIMGLRKFI